MLAKTIDIFLIFLMVSTIAFIAWKAIALYRPQLLKLDDLETKPPQDGHDLEERIERLESGLPVIATIASSGPFVGLSATVLHIMTALAAIKGASLDIGLVAGPIATALNSTLLGLGSAVPAAIAYNLFIRRVQLLENRGKRELAKKGAAG